MIHQEPFSDIYISSLKNLSESNAEIRKCTIQYHNRYIVWSIYEPLWLSRASHVVLGGTHEFDRYDTKVDTKERERILKGCIELEPSLKVYNTD